MDIQHLFFDLDYTLWDFEENSKDVLYELFEEYHLENRGCPIDFESFWTLYFHINEKLWGDYAKGYIQGNTLKVKRFWKTLLEIDINDMDLSVALSKEYLERLPYKKQLIPDAENILHYLKKKGYYLHIISNGFNKETHIKLKETGIINFFNTVITSEMCMKSKPHPSIFNLAINLAGTNSCYSCMIGDHVRNDIEGGKEAGMYTIWFNNNNMHENKLVPQADKIIHSLMDIKKIF
ncbi:MAG: YjjG family noncanonical pyrimidine nucleotidase [Phycisphaerales bacterium]|nr:YjjG family noncanonical pyrimidine nucleotidase [Phycisphaerales bacterium]